MDSNRWLDNEHQFGLSDDASGMEERKTSYAGSTELGVLGSKPPEGCI